jgi:arylsulfatase A-like enzyme
MTIRGIQSVAEAAIVWTVLLGLAAGRPPAEAGRETQQQRPNVLLLLTDDQRYNTIRALGHPDVLTPNLDRLAGRGTTFTRAHIMGGLQPAVCAPSRAMLFTGRGLFGLRDTGNVIPVEHATLPEALRRAGYTTFATGKWHNDRAAFARAWTAADRIFFGGMHSPKEGGHEAPWLFPFDPDGRYPVSSKVQARGFSSTLFADAAVRFLEGQAAATAPFFAYVAFTSPHDPRTPPPEFARQYDAERITLPPNFKPAHPFDNGELEIRDERLLPRPLTARSVRRELAAYYAMITEVDAQIGRVLGTLERAGLAERTIVVFAGDNGLAVGSHGLLGKQNLYEESVRVPLVFAGPGIPRGERRQHLALLSDVFPTIASLVGVNPPATVEGKSLVSAIRTPESRLRDGVFYAYRDWQRGFRTADDWKVIEYRVGGAHRRQLFNLADDPWEMRDLADDPAMSDRLASMRRLLERAMRDSGDPQSRPR